MEKIDPNTFIFGISLMFSSEWFAHRTLVEEIKKKYQIHPEWVLGHSEIAPNRKKDPGKKFNWKEIKKIFK